MKLSIREVKGCVRYFSKLSPLTFWILGEVMMKITNPEVLKSKEEYPKLTSNMK